MANLYADEQFPYVTTARLRTLGHDVLTVQEAGKGNQGIPDDEVLQFATSLDRAVLTLNRRDLSNCTIKTLITQASSPVPTTQTKMYWAKGYISPFKTQLISINNSSALFVHHDESDL